MSGIIIALNVGRGSVAGALVNQQGRILHKLPDWAYRSDNPVIRCSSLVQEALQLCQQWKYQPLAIGISTKGEVKDGIVKFNGSEQAGISLKQSLETQFQLPTKVLNRFHACALGVSDKLQSEASLGVINVSDSVGYGTVSLGKAQESYDPVKGAGGLRMIKRLSDRRLMPIANIAGSSTLAKWAESRRKSVAELFQHSISGGRYGDLILKDAEAAVAELAGDLHDTFKPQKIVAMLYDHESLSQSEREHFLAGVQKQLQVKYPSAPDIQLISSLSEEDAKLIGAAKAAIREIQSEVSSGRRSEYSEERHIFAVTGEPASGKTTFVAQTLIEKLRENGLKVGGVISQEIRNHRHQRTGFEMRILSPDGNRSEPIELAVVEKYAPPKMDLSGYTHFMASVSTFLVNVRNVAEHIVPKLKKVQRDADVVVIDELATMQLFSRDFEQAVKGILASKIPTIVTIPKRSHAPIIEKIRRVAASNGQLCTLSVEHRSGSQKRGEEELLPRIIEAVKKFRAVQCADEKSEASEALQSFDSCERPSKRRKISLQSEE